MGDYTCDDDLSLCKSWKVEVSAENQKKKKTLSSNNIHRGDACTTARLRFEIAVKLYLGCSIGFLLERRMYSIIYRRLPFDAVVYLVNDTKCSLYDIDYPCIICRGSYCPQFFGGDCYVGG